MHIDGKNIDKANVLVQALPYIQKYDKKTIVIKYGGNAMISETLKRAVISDVVLLSLVGINVVMVHGGGPEINEMLSKIGKESKFVGGMRYTDEETMDVVQMVLAGKINKQLVGQINDLGGKAVGLCGIDGDMLKAKKLTQNGFDLGYVGEITTVDTTIIDDAMEKGYTPVISTVAGGEHGSAFNINADIAAAKIAAAMKAEKLILLTDVRGLLRDKEDENSLISVVHVSEVSGLESEGIISGGMIPKIECCVEAVRRGVKRAHIIDGRIEHSILIELLSDEGIGTMFE